MPLLIRGYRQVSDIYLLGLAKKMGGYLATFDAGIPLSAVIGATRDTIAIISDGILTSRRVLPAAPKRAARRRDSAVPRTNISLAKPHKFQQFDGHAA